LIVPINHPTTEGRLYGTVASVRPVRGYHDTTTGTHPEQLEARKQRAEKKSLWFFIRRAPFRTIEREWKRPTDDQYNNDLMAEGFISPALVEHPLSDELKTDLRELDEHLLPHFWQANQRARFFQNRYYQYQWAFILAAFFTTALAAVNVFFHAQGWSGETSAGTIVALRRFRFLMPTRHLKSAGTRLACRPKSCVRCISCTSPARNPLIRPASASASSACGAKSLKCYAKRSLRRDETTARPHNPAPHPSPELLPLLPPRAQGALATPVPAPANSKRPQPTGYM